MTATDRAPIFSEGNPGTQIAWQGSLTHMTRGMPDEWIARSNGWWVLAAATIWLLLAGGNLLFQKSFAAQTGGLSFLDFALGATPDQAQQLLHDYGERGREIHRWFVVFGFLYATSAYVLAAALIAFLLRASGTEKSMWRVLMLIPVFGLAVEWAENSALLVLLSRYPADVTVSGWAVYLLRICKFGTIGSTALALAMLGAFSIIRRTAT
jgi:hypothetical protein